MISFQMLLKRLKETLGPVQIEIRVYVKRKQVTFVSKRKEKLFFHLAEFLHSFVLIKAFLCMLSLHRGKKKPEDSLWCKLGGGYEYKDWICLEGAVDIKTESTLHESFCFSRCQPLPSEKINTFEALWSRKNELLQEHWVILLLSFWQIRNHHVGEYTTNKTMISWPALWEERETTR